MRITYVARSFLDYRVPVLAELDKILDGKLSFICSTRWTPERALNRLKAVLSDRALYLKGERSIGTDMPLNANTTFCLPYQPGLLRAIRSTRPDVVMGDGFFQWSYAALWQKLRYGTPLVICYERWAHTEKNAQWYRKLYRRLALKLTDAVCCNGKLSADYTATLGFPAHRITTGHMAADTEQLATASATVGKGTIEALRKSWVAEGLVFLYVGQLIPRKGLGELLTAWARFEDQAPHLATLVLVGSGPSEAALKAQAGVLGLSRARFVGAVDYAHLASIYAAADAFIIPTLEDNWSLVVPEAMACGLPILCSRYNGCWPELVQEGQNGWLFDPLNPQSVLECLKKAAEVPSSLPAMGRESRRVVAKHSPAHAAQAIYSACKLACSASS